MNFVENIEIVLTIDEFHREKAMSKSCIMVEFLSLNVIQGIYLLKYPKV